MHRIFVLFAVLVLVAIPGPAQAASVTPGADFSRFPRPARDNGRGIHWIPAIVAQPPEGVDRFIGEADQMGIRWIKLMQGDQPKVEHAYLLRSMAQRGMMPVLRVYKRFNTPYEHLTALVMAAKPFGVVYYELYNEPNIDGEAGGWPDNGKPDVEAIAQLWLPAARQVIAAGGFPSLPGLSPGGSYDDVRFLRAFLGRVIELGGDDALRSSWAALHNYSLNHPIDYPRDHVNLLSTPLSTAEIARRRLTPEEVALINQARSISRLPRSQGGYYVGDTIDQDSNGFHKFEAYAQVIEQETGRLMPIITTEGGVIPGSQEDPRYPKTTDDDVATQTVDAFRYMAQEAPDYYFAFLPWLVANYAGGSTDGRWEPAAWYRGPQGEPAPVVEAVKRLAQTLRPGGSRERHFAPTTGEASASSIDPGATPTPTWPQRSPTPGSGSAPASSYATPVPPYRSLPDPKPGWVLFWRDAEVFNCVAVDLSFAETALQAWQPPSDGRRWSMDIRDGTGKRLALVGQPVPHSGSGPLPSAVMQSCPPLPGVQTPTPEPTATPTQTPPVRKWDQRLDLLGIRVSEAPVGSQAAWRLISARFEDETQSGGRHNIYIRLLDEWGRPTTGIATVRWRDGQETLTVLAAPLQRLDPYETYGANFPIYGQVGSYSVSVTSGLNDLSETISGLGMLGKTHVNYILIFQRIAN
jgi:hypothetical protein